MTTGKAIALTRWTFVGKVMSLHFNMLSRKWQPTPVFLPGKSHGWRNLVGYSSWGRKESDTTERLHSLRLVIGFVSSNKCLLTLWLQSPYAVILEPKKIKSDSVSTVSPSISHEVMGPDAMILVF